ncbi:MAG: ergothioneine biosynthesis protein EgtB [Hyphomicrobiaceae bacterium]
MVASTAKRTRAPADVLSQFAQVRDVSRQRALPLSDADATVQSMPDASPAKWHLAHTTWFFERMILAPNLADYRAFDESFNFLFNSYYETIGARQPRPRRGMITRPTLDTVLAYREHVNEAITRLLEKTSDPDITTLVELGCHHEQQHQELLLTDILHLFAQNPLQPAYKDPEPLAVDLSAPTDTSWQSYDGGIVEIGHDGQGFHFDCEGPRHKTLLEPHALGQRLVTNGDWIEFIADGGYRQPLHWLSAGWDSVKANAWSMPLYWTQRDDEYWTMTLRGAQPVDRAAPVTHISYFEADAFATWAGHRLPSEAEWENAAAPMAISGNFADSGRLRPKPADDTAIGLTQMFGDTWEWTRSPYTAYPRFKAPDGAVGEYNGKFMCGQFVLRGGSCATPSDHVRTTYRNFFPPDARWQFSGLRLAKDL